MPCLGGGGRFRPAPRSGQQAVPSAGCLGNQNGSRIQQKPFSLRHDREVGWMGMDDSTLSPCHAHAHTHVSITAAVLKPDLRWSISTDSDPDSDARPIGLLELWKRHVPDLLPPGDEPRLTLRAQRNRLQCGYRRSPRRKGALTASAWEATGWARKDPSCN